VVLREQPACQRAVRQIELCDTMSVVLGSELVESCWEREAEIATEVNTHARCLNADDRERQLAYGGIYTRISTPSKRLCVIWQDQMRSTNLRARCLRA
jgi:hypothetical protein